MSPQSRGRKQKSSKAGKQRRSELNPYAVVLRRFAPVATGADSLEVELFASGILGALHQPLARQDPVLDLIAFLGEKPTEPARRLLDAVCRLATTDEQRARAADALGALPAPSEDTRFVAAHQFADVYGDQATLLLIFERGGDRHGLFVLLDFNHLGGWVKDIGLADEPGEVLRDMRAAQLESGGIARVADVDAAHARRLIEDGIAATDMTIDADASEDYSELRALLLARCRAMPDAAPERQEHDYDDGAREALVEEFLRDSGFADTGSARYLARLLVDFGCDYDAGQPQRIGPAKLETFLLGFLPRKVVLDADDRAAMPGFARAWTEWAAERNDLPDAARTELADALSDVLEEFDSAYDDAANASPTKAILAGLAPEANKADVEQLVERRMFAMPYFGTSIGDEDYPHLDPNDEDDLSLLVLGEHPQFHDVLADPDFDGEIDGMNPRLHLAVDETVIRQLWDGDPPEAWQAAQRLCAHGMDRLEVIHELAAVLVEHLWHAMQDEDGADLTAYTDALDRLGSKGKRASRKATPRGADVLLQLKITLRGSRPPIWRRLRLPAATTLDELHGVIQAAFGWEDAHLHAFEAGGVRYAPREAELDRARPTEGVPIGAVLRTVGARLRYEYDFGDGWEHDIVLEETRTPNGVPRAVCTAGRRAGPVEDCGGIGGWEYLCEVLADPTHPEHGDRLEWLGFIPDPTAFDLDAVNHALSQVPVSS